MLLGMPRAAGLTIGENSRLALDGFDPYEWPLVAQAVENEGVDPRRPAGPLAPRAYLLLLYRADWLANGSAAAPPVPDTWPQLLDLAQALQGQDLSGSGVPVGGLCLDLQPRCGKAAALLTAILASLNQFQPAAGGAGTQVAGYTQGLFFDPVTYRPLAGGPAGSYALQLLAGLAAVSNTSSPIQSQQGQAGCGRLNPLFMQGSCGNNTLTATVMQQLQRAAAGRSWLVNRAPLSSLAVPDVQLPGIASGAAAQLLYTEASTLAYMSSR
ncbi:guanylate cyclase domain-containing protein [Haematococcus lacustris]|uniref:Guanylate cyclase domain-containing protein n=1 Tax=Haematococcus lacustris TaxID=44745 RepID=A0A699Y8Y6_HAELA|nr:guanylate cyclase domain-containing protein [Haematococcus lacustris]